MCTYQILKVSFWLEACKVGNIPNQLKLTVWDELQRPRQISNENKYHQIAGNRTNNIKENGNMYS